MLHKFGAAREEVEGRAKVSHVRKNEAVLRLAARHVRRGKACAQKNKSRDRSNVVLRVKHEGFFIAAVLKAEDHGEIQFSSVIWIPIEGECV